MALECEKAGPVWPLGQSLLLSANTAGAPVYQILQGGGQLSLDPCRRWTGIGTVRRAGRKSLGHREARDRTSDLGREIGEWGPQGRPGALRRGLESRITSDQGESGSQGEAVAPRSRCFSHGTCSSLGRWRIAGWPQED